MNFILFSVFGKPALGGEKAGGGEIPPMPNKQISPFFFPLEGRPATSMCVALISYCSRKVFKGSCSTLSYPLSPISYPLSPWPPTLLRPSPPSLFFPSHPKPPSRSLQVYFPTHSLHPLPAEVGISILFFLRIIFITFVSVKKIDFPFFYVRKPSPLSLLFFFRPTIYI